jgi:lipopolysaccharide heptosyltransferase II
MSDWHLARNVLCVRLDSLGDVLMTSPALRALKETLPERRITLLSSSSGAAAGRQIPEVDEVLAWDAPWMKASAVRRESRADRLFCDKLRLRGFDAAVIFTVFSQSALPPALLCYWADIPRRLAYCRENPYQLLTDWVPETEPEQGIGHEVERQLKLVKTIGCSTRSEQLSFRVLPKDREELGELLAQTNLNETAPWIVIHPGATAPSRRYPVRQFAAAANELCRRGFQIVITGSPDESSLVNELQADLHTPGISLAGRLTLGQLAALLERSPLLLTNNTGPAHLAAALQTPVVDLYALTNPQHAPWGVNHRILSYDVPCKYCFKSSCPEGHHDCLQRIPPEDVASAVLDVYRERLLEPQAPFNEARRTDRLTPI